MRRLVLLTLALAAALPVLRASALEGEPLEHSALEGEAVIADLSEHLIAITSNFTGAEILLFGVVEAPDRVTPALERDVVAVVRGPYEPLVVRQKERVAGVWINTGAREVKEAPGFYVVASTRAVDELAEPEVLRDAGIGLDFLQIEGGLADDELPWDYRQAVFRAKAREQLYAEQPDAVTFVGRSLFRVEIDLPATVPVGSYVATVYLFDDGHITAQRSVNLLVNKTGFERIMNTFSQRTPFLYGLTAILVAVLAGWGASLVFRDD